MLVQTFWQSVRLGDFPDTLVDIGMWRYEGSTRRTAVRKAGYALNRPSGSSGDLAIQSGSIQVVSTKLQVARDGLQGMVATLAEVSTPSGYLASHQPNACSTAVQHPLAYR